MTGLTEQDHADLARVATMAAEALALLKAVESRHGLDLTGPAVSALGRAHIDLEMAGVDARLAERYMEG